MPHLKVTISKKTFKVKGPLTFKTGRVALSLTAGGAKVLPAKGTITFKSKLTRTPCLTGWGVVGSGSTRQTLSPDSPTPIGHATRREVLSPPLVDAALADERYSDLL
jgi:hypothetical protein